MTTKPYFCPMQVHRSLNSLPPFTNAVITIGTFDGVHQGHQQLVSRINQIAQDKEGESVIITFHPHPRIVLNHDPASLRLITTLEEKIELLKSYDVDHVAVVPFSKEFSQQTAEEYVKDFLWGKFKPHTIVIGYDHRFGKGRTGDIDLLKSMGNELGFQVEEIGQQQVEDITVSSTKVRNALLEGDIELANDLMGHIFTLTGTVVSGKKIGHTIGFPTANLEIEGSYKLVPAEGIYAVYTIVKGVRYKGMLYIGTSPTVDGTKRTIEVNIFDFDQDIYGEEATLEFVATIRGDEKFESLEAMTEQLYRDKESALKLLS